MVDETPGIVCPNCGRPEPNPAVRLCPNCGAGLPVPPGFVAQQPLMPPVIAPGQAHTTVGNVAGLAATVP